jgi:hypothetical protein
MRGAICSAAKAWLAIIARAVDHPAKLDFDIGLGVAVHRRKSMFERT